MTNKPFETINAYRYRMSSPVPDSIYVVPVVLNKFVVVYVVYSSIYLY